jgi:hypothetical protein
LLHCSSTAAMLASVWISCIIICLNFSSSAMGRRTGNYFVRFFTVGNERLTALPCINYE